jgi:DNA repair protein RecN (Recombination protein N)
MLVGLSVRDVVLIDRLDLALEPGLGVLTGETGAGKSILLDALGLALGARADSALVRHGAAQATVTAAFTLGRRHHPAHAILDELGLDDGEELVLRRQLAADGRSRAFINDQPVSVAGLRRVGESLVEIVGQGEQRGLLDPGSHRALLDAYGGLEGQAVAVAEAWSGWRQATAAREEAVGRLQQARREEDFLRHALLELDALKPQPGEEEKLAESRTRLLNREKLLEAMRGAAAELGGRSGAEAQLAAAAKRLARIADKAGEGLTPLLAALDRAGIEAAEASRLLDRLTGELDAEPGRLEAIEERLFALRDLARKHGVAVDGLPALRERTEATLAALDDQGGAVARLTQAEAAARQAYRDAASALSSARRAAAGRLDKAVAAELPPLKLDKARFRTTVEALPQAGWGPQGPDRIGFEVSTNPGTPLGGLGRIASGGELSRFLLAIKVALAAAAPVPTLVFDEVDAGIGGATAAAVGERLKRLAARLQVLVVTHSPQVAALAGRHWRVEKAAADGGEPVLTRIVALDPPGRREEIARMLSGARVTGEARAAADRLLAGSRA